MKDVIIVIPIYKPFSETERCAFNRCREVLGTYPTTLLQPESFDSSPILAENEGVTATCFPELERRAALRLREQPHAEFFAHIGHSCEKICGIVDYFPKNQYLCTLHV